MKNNKFLKFSDRQLPTITNFVIENNITFNVKNKALVARSGKPDNLFVVEECLKFHRQ